MAVVIAIVLAVLSAISGKAGMKFVSKATGLAAILVFIGWLASGPGFALLEWINNPSVDVPSVDINQ